MKTGRLVSQGLAAIRQHKLRSFFMMLGSFLGVAALTLVMSAGSAIETKMMRTVNQLFSAESIFLTAGGGFLMTGARGGARLTLDDIEAVVAEVDGIAACDPLELVVAQARFGDTSTSVRLMGQSERVEQVWGRHVTRGEWYTQTDVARASQVAVLGATAARALLGEREPIGAEILVNGVPLQVLGLLEPMGTDIHGLDRDNEIVVPITTVMRRLLNTDTIRGAKLLAADASTAEALAPRIAAVLRARHHIGEDQPDDFTLLTPAAVQSVLSRTRRMLSAFLPLGALITLLVGAALSAALMTFSVTTRKREIGLRRAVGARARDIAGQLLWETVTTSAVGGLLGAGAGAALTFLIAGRLQLVGATPSAAAAVVGLLVAATAGLIAGLLPARKAAALSPVDALR